MLERFESMSVDLQSLAATIARHSTQQMIEDSSTGLPSSSYLAAAQYPEL